MTAAYLPSFYRNAVIKYGVDIKFDRWYGVNIQLRLSLLLLLLLSSLSVLVYGLTYHVPFAPLLLHRT